MFPLIQFDDTNHLNVSAFNGMHDITIHIQYYILEKTSWYLMKHNREHDIILIKSDGRNI